MDGWGDMADGGVGIVTALGMGTVFFCLILLYATTRILGALLGPKPAPAEPAAAPSDDASSEGPAAPDPDDSKILAAMTLVLARHRAARSKPAATSGGDDPWKIAGRISMLR